MASSATRVCGAPASTAVATDSRTASICAVYDEASDLATRAATEASTLPRTVTGRPLPEVTAAVNPSGTT